MLRYVYGYRRAAAALLLCGLVSGLCATVQEADTSWARRRGLGGPGGRAGVDEGAVPDGPDANDGDAQRDRLAQGRQAPLTAQSMRRHLYAAADCSNSTMRMNGTVAVATCCSSFNIADDAGDGEALQSMLDSGLHTAFVPAIGRPWVINASLHLRSNQTVLLAPSVEIQARKGGYHCNGTAVTSPTRPSKYCQSPTQPCKCHGNLTLFSATDVSHMHLLGFGAVLRMHQADYSDPSRYQPAQWRPAVVLAGVTDSSVQGLTIVSTGGDGVSVYAGGSPAQLPTERVLLKDLTIRQAYRNALSVTSARDLVVEDCIFADTCQEHGNFGGPCSGATSGTTGTMVPSYRRLLYVELAAPNQRISQLYSTTVASAVAPASLPTA